MKDWRLIVMSQICWNADTVRWCDRCGARHNTARSCVGLGAENAKLNEKILVPEEGLTGFGFKPSFQSRIILEEGVATDGESHA